MFIYLKKRNNSQRYYEKLIILEWLLLNYLFQNQLDLL